MSVISIIKSVATAPARGFRRVCQYITAAMAATVATSPVMAALPSVAPQNAQNIASGDILGVARDYTDQSVDFATLAGGVVLMLLAVSGIGVSLYQYNQGRGSMGMVMSALVMGGLVCIVGIYLLTEANAIF
ncbi:DUF2976 domain-containing protein [Nitrogeniibacter aestuarii]|uniref:DUF2976 domain-containing protein n=1 Tax=Nitrogeniibacter aestuarii TaxID=2815343 RepID=UPI001E3BDFD6|nr:DUF2976 domain-containing protein [Nitrogeniibacter aestuarii]